MRRYTKVYKLVSDAKLDYIFPGSEKKTEAFRSVSHVFLQRREDSAARAAAQGDGPPPIQKLVVSNFHVVSGSGSHKVPGVSAPKRVAFKARVVTKGIEKAVRFAEERAGAAQAAAQGGRIDFLAAGDFNLNRDHVKEALETVESDMTVVETLVLHCVDDEHLLPLQQKKQRDFIIASRTCG